MEGFNMTESTFDFLSQIFPILFILVLAIILANILGNVLQYLKNNRSPILTVSATIVTKRTKVYHLHGGDMHHSSSGTYYVTFQLENGGRMELNVKEEEYGLLAEGDKGMLTFQGIRYLSFQQNNTSVF